MEDSIEFKPFAYDGVEFLGPPDSVYADKVVARTHHHFYDVESVTWRVTSEAHKEGGCLGCCCQKMVAEERSKFVQNANSLIYHQEVDFIEDGYEYPQAAWLGALAYMNTQDTFGWIDSLLQQWAGVLGADGGKVDPEAETALLQ